VLTGADAGIPKTEIRTTAAVANAAAVTDACRLAEREGAGPEVLIAAADGTCNTMACDKAGAGSARVMAADGTAKLTPTTGAAAAVTIFVGVGQSRVIPVVSAGEGLNVVIATGSGACSES
jgi:hypothetical protein